MKHTLHIGDCMKVLSQLSAKSVDCVITSPPYWGLRFYGKNAEMDWPDGWHGQLGLEPDFNTYVDHIAQVFREVKRVLKDEGSLWLNMGDTYAGGWGAEGKPEDWEDLHTRHKEKYPIRSVTKHASLPAKCLIEIPSRVVLRLIDSEGWILRNRVVWFKKNHMPSSVKDRLANSHEYIFHLVKSRPRSELPMFDSPITNIDASWLGAMVDAEGTIGISRSKGNGGQHDVFAAFVQVSNTWKPIVERCKQMTRVGSMREEAGTNFNLWSWRVQASDAVRVIFEIYPYLMQKTEQAKVAIALQKTNKHRGNNKGENRGPRPISGMEYQEKVKLYELCKGLNQRSVQSSDLPEPNLSRFGSCEDYHYDLDAIREPHQSAIGNKRFNIRVRDAQKGRLEQKWGDQYSATEGEVSGYNEAEYGGKFVEVAPETAEQYNSPRARTQRQAKIQEEIGDAHQGKSTAGLYDPERLSYYHEKGKNPGDVVESPSFPEQPPHTSYGSRRDVTGSMYPPDEPGHPLGKNPGDVVTDHKMAQVPGPHVRHSLSLIPGHQGDQGYLSGSNPGDFWDYTTKPFPEAHFATFPEDICIRPIRATCPPNGIVLDPFSGSGTVAKVARDLGRNSISIELVPEYEKLWHLRLGTATKAFDVEYEVVK